MLRGYSYQMYEMAHAALAPARAVSDATHFVFRNPFNPFSNTAFGKNMAAGAELFERIRLLRLSAPLWNRPGARGQSRRRRFRGRALAAAAGARGAGPDPFARTWKSRAARRLSAAVDLARAPPVGQPIGSEFVRGGPEMAPLQAKMRTTFTL